MGRSTFPFEHPLTLFQLIARLTHDAVARVVEVEIQRAPPSFRGKDSSNLPDTTSGMVILTLYHHPIFSFCGIKDL